MDICPHERGEEMMQSQYVKRGSVKNYFPVPNAVFNLGLHQSEIAIYAYLMCIEDRRTYQCIASYSTIGEKLGISVNTVAKYVGKLEEHGLIRTEHTDVITKGGLKRNGCLRYTVLPIRYAIDLYHERQIKELAQMSEQETTRANAEKRGVKFISADNEQSA